MMTYYTTAELVDFAMKAQDILADLEDGIAVPSDVHPKVLEILKSLAPTEV